MFPYYRVYPYSQQQPSVRYRYNPEEIAAALARAIGMVQPEVIAIIDRVLSRPAFAPLIPQFEERLRQDGYLGVLAAVPETPPALTDREGWLKLAELVPVALATEPRELQDALIAEFRAEAERAAA